MKYAAFIEAKREDGPGLVRIPVFPRSTKTMLFESREAAVRKMESLKIAGRGLIYDADGRAFCDRVAEFTIAL